MALNLKMGGAPKGDPNKKKNGPKEFFEDYKKQVIKLGIVMAVCAIAAFASNKVHAHYSGEKAAAMARATDTYNKLDVLKKDEVFTGESAGTRMDALTTQVEWIGTKADTGRWMSDEEIFWEFISPAFNFNSATEYNKMREDYISQLGNCLFTVQFLSYYDVESKCRVDENGNVNQVDFEKYNAAYTCSSDKSHYRTYPVGVDSDGNYTYFALVPMRNTYVAFTYRVVHGVGQGGTERITLADFDCWPPNSGAKMGVY